MRALRLFAILTVAAVACTRAPVGSGTAPITTTEQPAASFTPAALATVPNSSATTNAPVTTSSPASTSAAPATAVSTPVATATAARTVTPTTAPTATPRTSAFTTLPPGSTLPTDQQCASAIARDQWEPRPENGAANQNNAWTSGFRLTGSYLSSIAPGYESRVTGNFTGTTDQIIRWSACKWGFDENDVRAQAVIESYWRQSTLGDCNKTTQPQTKGCASVGLLQVQGANIPATHPGTWPAAMTSTAFNLDYALAVRRLCYDGKETWMRQYNTTYAAGDLWGCIGRWYSGRWHDAGAETYIARVKSALNAKTWASPSF